MANPVEQAIAPLKALAVKYASGRAGMQAARLYEQLEKSGWNLDIAAPRGDSRRDGRYEYCRKNALRSTFAAVTETVTSEDYRPHRPLIVRRTDARLAKFIKDAEDDAAHSFDLYSAKLTGKVGAVVHAEIDGRHLWQGSTLTVTTEAGEKQRWFTQQIVNCSKLGNLFNQYPTRKLK